MTVYKYYVQAVRPWNAVIFVIACAMFVIGLSLPREYTLYARLREIDTNIRRIRGEMVASNQR
jgi:hypothetical protein